MLFYCICAGEKQNNIMSNDDKKRTKWGTTTYAFSKTPVAVTGFMAGKDHIQSRVH